MGKEGGINDKTGTKGSFHKGKTTVEKSKSKHSKAPFFRINSMMKNKNTYENFKAELLG